MENMIKYFFLVVFIFILISKPEVESNKIEDKIVAYFSSHMVKNFNDVWKKSRKGFETSVAAFLKESYGANTGTMNVYVQRHEQPQELCDGFIANDNIVTVLFVNLYLREIPQMLMPDVSLSLSHNVIRVETKLNKMFIDADYFLMRNRSDIDYEVKDPLKTSPFARQQVQTSGIATIIAEDCHVVGLAVVTLTGVTPHIGHTMFRVVNCKFSIEIYSPGLASPPVIAPYFSKEQSYQLQNMMSNPISDELSAKLQGVLVTLVNTSAVFGPEMVQYRLAQKKIFKDTERYMSMVVRHLNKASIRENQGVVAMNSLEVAFDDGVLKDDEKDLSVIKIHSVTMNGLDMAYATLRGGPIKMGSDMIVDEIRFYRLQIRGKLYFENSTSKGVYDFAAELIDVPVSVLIKMEESKKDQKSKKQLDNFDIRRWRDMVFIPGNMRKVKVSLMPGDTLTLGYLIQEVPRAITKHLEEVFQKAIDVDDEDQENKLNQYDDHVQKLKAIDENY